MFDFNQTNQIWSVQSSNFSQVICKFKTDSLKKDGSKELAFTGLCLLLCVSSEAKATPSAVNYPVAAHPSWHYIQTARSQARWNLMFLPVGVRNTVLFWVRVCTRVWVPAAEQGNSWACEWPSYEVWSSWWSAGCPYTRCPEWSPSQWRNLHHTQMGGFSTLVREKLILILSKVILNMLPAQCK